MGNFRGSKNTAQLDKIVVKLNQNTRYYTLHINSFNCSLQKTTSLNLLKNVVVNVNFSNVL